MGISQLKPIDNALEYLLNELPASGSGVSS